MFYKITVTQGEKNMTVLINSIGKSYSRDGFVFPINVISAKESQSIRADLERAEKECTGDSEKLALVRSYPNHLIPSFDRLIRNENLLEVIQLILGPNILVWSSGLFIKEANSTNFVTWHQDLTYWGLDDAEEVTAWVALSPSNRESGCMRFIPGSHNNQLVSHRDTFDKQNLLTRGQEIATEVDDSKGVDIILNTGQASLHHGHLFHSSGPNTTNDRRIGSAIRYIKTSMKQRSGDKALVTLVRGQDKFENFLQSEPPKGWLHEYDFEACRRDAQFKRRVLYEGAESEEGQRY